jgi:hypothetical protein
MTVPRPWGHSIWPKHLSPSGAHGHPRGAKSGRWPRMLDRYTETGYGARHVEMTARISLECRPEITTTRIPPNTPIRIR